MLPFSGTNIPSEQSMDGSTDDYLVEQMTLPSVIVLVFDLENTSTSCMYSLIMSNTLTFVIFMTLFVAVPIHGTDSPTYEPTHEPTYIPTHLPTRQPTISDSTDDPTAESGTTPSPILLSQQLLELSGYGHYDTSSFLNQ